MKNYKHELSIIHVYGTVESLVALVENTFVDRHLRASLGVGVMYSPIYSAKYMLLKICCKCCQSKAPAIPSFPLLIGPWPGRDSLVY